ncbi:MAG: DUF952 domain-containing protein [Paracoccus sp. (in: a-proteobacteria)]|nr:DUF952 domain-containing protein [Paracoccus sp. (in: a-proteobacteria)]
MMIYKLLRGPEWDQFQKDRRTMGAPVDLADGYIHFSTAKTLPGTLEKHFSGESGLWLLGADTATMGDALIWEPSRGGLLFPHLYRALWMEEVIFSRALPDGATARDLGDLA